jgi:hypothetical protein
MIVVLPRGCPYGDLGLLDSLRLGAMRVDGGNGEGVPVGGTAFSES